MCLFAALVPSSQRIYPSTPLEFPQPHPLQIAANERVSFQVALRHENPYPVMIEAAVTSAFGPVRLRRVGYVPVRHLNTVWGDDVTDIEGREHFPGFIPDVLLEGGTFDVPPAETHVFWVTLDPKEGGAAPGLHEVEITFTNKTFPEQPPVIVRQPVEVESVTLPLPLKFPITHWFYADALMDWHQTDGFDERFWSILPAYLRNMTEHGSNVLFVPLFTPPLDGVKRPSQLLKVARAEDGSYRFDWSDVERYIALAKENGIQYFEWTHLFTQWGVEHAIRIYEGQGRDEKLLWPPDTAATSPVYRTFLTALFEQWHAFLIRHELLETSYFHLSDEPHSEHLANYQAARDLLRELAPWMKVMDALSDIEFGRRGLTDLPIPSIKTAVQFQEEGITSGCYYCCGPRGNYLNRLMDTPLAKIGMSGFLFYRWPFKIFLHWGYNYWYKQQSRKMIDPFTVQDGEAWPGWAYGDTFVVYPGENGPLDSIRWEIFAESLNDFALLEAAGIPKDDPLLAELRDFADFPKTAQWRRDTRKQLFARLAASTPQ